MVIVMSIQYATGLIRACATPPPPRCDILSSLFSFSTEMPFVPDKTRPRQLGLQPYEAICTMHANFTDKY